MKKIFIKNRIRQKKEFQFFMHQFVETCIKYGFESKKDLFPSYRFHIRALLRFFLFKLFCIKNKISKNKDFDEAILVTCSGGTIIDNAFPYFYNKEIIPIVWDIWPPSFTEFYDSLNLLKCKTIFVTVKSIALKLRNDFNINAYWMPEGIDSSIYEKGLCLKDRKFDVFEMGRQMPKLHKILSKLNETGKLNGYITSNSKEKDKTWMPFEELIKIIPKCKIIVCFPRCDTNPKAKGVETLTQRYWEGMLCRCIMIGRAPQELIDLCGYNPVIDINWENPEFQLIDILTNIETYQELVDRNYVFAINHADWKFRMDELKNNLVYSDYQI